MNDSVLNRFTANAREPVRDAAIDADADGSEDFGAFGWLRGPSRERAVMLELRKKSGNIMAIGYGWIDRMEFDATRIILHVGKNEVLIKGRNLNTETRPQVRLFQGLARHRVTYIQEADHAMSLQAEKKEVVVEAIEW